jgi:ATP-binding cassette subfamily B protein RaxB
MMHSRRINRGYIDGLQLGWRRKLPMILQTEATECGLACLAMVAHYHGHDVDLPSLRRKFSISLRGVNLKRLMETAGRLGFDSRPLRLELEGVRHLSTPCVLHWDLHHFVVLKQATARGVVIHDPARGVLRLSNAEFSKHFTGVALECAPRADFTPVKARQSISLRALTGKVKGLPRAFAQILLLAVALEVFAIIGPLYMQWVLDQVLVSADANLLTVLGAGFLLVVVFQALISSLRAWTITWVGALLNAQWATNVFSHLLKLPMDWYEKRHVGDVVSRFSSMTSIQKTLTTDFVAALLDGVMAVLVAVVLSLYSLKLTAIVVSACALYSLLRWQTYKPLRHAQEEQIIYAARQQTELLEAVRGAQTLKLHNQQYQRATRFANTVVDTVNREVAMQRLNITFLACKHLIFGIERIALVWLAAMLVLNGNFTAGMLVAYVAFAEQFVNRIGSLTDKGIEFRMLRLHAERVADIALADSERQVEGGWSGPRPEAIIQVRNLSFRYAEGEPWILKDCSLMIAAGESVALVGSSGCGKTTLAKIILGLLTPDEGEVLYGGVDIRHLGLGYYRSLVGTVMQNDQLFAGSIADNIAGFDTTSSLRRIETAARQAAIHDEIVAMPMGYQSLVGDLASALSGGQKQRILLARALYRRPSLLVLDEATSHLDTERERQVTAAINGTGVTRLVISHRPDTIVGVHRTMAVVNGTVRPATTRPYGSEAPGVERIHVIPRVRELAKDAEANSGE